MLIIAADALIDGDLNGLESVRDEEEELVEEPKDDKLGFCEIQ